MLDDIFLPLLSFFFLTSFLQGTRDTYDKGKIKNRAVNLKVYDRNPFLIFFFKKRLHLECLWMWQVLLPCCTRREYAMGICMDIIYSWESSFVACFVVCFLICFWKRYDPSNGSAMLIDLGASFRAVEAVCEELDFRAFLVLATEVEIEDVKASKTFSAAITALQTALDKALKNWHTKI